MSNASAIISGCPIQLMSSGHAVLSSLVFAYISEKLELPKGAVNVCFGNFRFFRQAAQDRRIKAILYSGSREHCETIRKEYQIPSRELILQSGGKNSLLLGPKGDLDLALKCAVLGTVKSAGQLNTSTSRVFVPTGVVDEFKERILKIIRELPIGPTDDDGQKPLMGPLYSKKAVDKFLRFQTMASREAKESLSWGKAYDCDTGGFFVTPGVHYFDKFDSSSAYQSNVLMCPDLAIYTYDELEEAIECINRTDAPLVNSYIGEKKSIMSLRNKIDAPNLLINLPTVGVEMVMPVSGKLQCGHHRLNGLGLCYLLTYPKAVQSDGKLEKRFASWPWPEGF